MSQAALQAPTTGTVAGLTMVQAINAAMAAIASQNSGNSDPGAIGAYTWWADTGNSLLKMRSADNSTWITICPLLATLLPLAGGNVTGPVNANRGTALPSAATVNIGAATGEYLHITGATTITAFDTVQAGTERTVVFDGILTLTYNATGMILPTAANITTAAGDTAKFRSEGAGNWKCISYQRANGAALAATPQTSVVRLNTTNGTGTTNTKYRRFTNVVSNTGSDITYADSATLGAAFTINTAGTYSISYSDVNTSTQIFAITLNDNQPTTVISSSTAANVLAAACTQTSGLGANCSWTGYLPAGSVINAKSDGTANSAGPLGQFSISRIA